MYVRIITKPTTEESTEKCCDPKYTGSYKTFHAVSVDVAREGKQSDMLIHLINGEDVKISFSPNTDVYLMNDNGDTISKY